LTAAQGRKVIAEMVAISSGETMHFHTIEGWLSEFLANKSDGVAERTMLRYRQVFRDFLAYLGPARANASIASVSPGDLIGFRDKLRQEGRSATTCNMVVKKVLSLESAMKKPSAASRESALGPTPLELIEIANGLPLNQNELALAFQSLAQQLWPTAEEKIADPIRARLTFARFYWQIAHEVCATPVSFPSDAPDYCPPELRRWFQLDNDGSQKIPGSKAAQFLEWKRPTFFKTWDEFIPRWKFRESDSYSESLLRQLEAHKADRKRKADREKNRRARKNLPKKKVKNFRAPDAAKMATQIAKMATFLTSEATFVAV
jgi:hypothetical protein